MKKIIVASNNENKIREIKQIFETLNITVSSLKDENIDVDIEETGNTFIENALLKARGIAKLVNCAVLSDDSGLEVFSLNNEPGVYSSRYAGPQKSDLDNNLKLIERLKGVESREARYTCAIALVVDGVEYTVENYCYGLISNKPKGENGFGYDSYFYIEELNKNMAELSSVEKNNISHRARALEDIFEKVKEVM